MSHPFPESPEFALLVSGETGVDLARVALEIARDADPGLAIDASLSQIDALADRVRPRIPDHPTSDDLLQQINWVLYVEEGFSGNEDDYYDPRNSSLNEVLERRIGIPISLGILYQAIAERLGLHLAGVNLPAHFVLRGAREDGSSVFIDPFHAGRLLDQDGCRQLVAQRTGSDVELTEEQFQPMSAAAVISRMLRNLRAIHLQAGDAASALLVLRRMVALEPADASLRRDLGVVSLNLDHLAEGIEQLSAYLEQASQATDAGPVRTLILDARRRLDEGG